LKITKSVFVSYGSTESSLVSFKLISDGNTFKEFSVGKPIVEKLRIVNRELQDCQPWEVGTILIRSKNVVSNYFNPLNVENSCPANVFLDNSWFNMEDVGFLDDEGELYVLGRQGDIIMNGPHHVYPGWLEKALAAHCNIMYVVIVPVSDLILFHEICACVKAMPGVLLTEDWLRQTTADLLIKDENDEYTPMPKYFLILDKLPETSTGKIDRKLLTRMAEKKFGKLGKNKKTV